MKVWMEGAGREDGLCDAADVDARFGAVGVAVEVVGAEDDGGGDGGREAGGGDEGSAVGGLW